MVTVMLHWMGWRPNLRQSYLPQFGHPVWKMEDCEDIGFIESVCRCVCATVLPCKNYCFAQSYKWGSRVVLHHMSHATMQRSWRTSCKRSSKPSRVLVWRCDCILCTFVYKRDEVCKLENKFSGVLFFGHLGVDQRDSILTPDCRSKPWSPFGKSMESGLEDPGVREKHRENISFALQRQKLL